MARGGHRGGGPGAAERLGRGGAPPSFREPANGRLAIVASGRRRSRRLEGEGAMTFALQHAPSEPTISRGSDGCGPVTTCNGPWTPVPPVREPTCRCLCGSDLGQLAILVVGVRAELSGRDLAVAAHGTPQRG